MRKKADTEGSFNKAPIISPELITANTQYAFTLNPSNDYQYFDNQDRVKSLEGYMKTWFFKKYKSFQCDLYMEVSRNGRLHFHGTITWKTDELILQFFLNELPDILTKFQVEIDTISDPKVWNTYCTKSSTKFKFPHLRTSDLRIRTAGDIKHKDYFTQPVKTIEI